MPLNQLHEKFICMKIVFYTANIIKSHVCITTFSLTIIFLIQRILNEHVHVMYQKFRLDLKLT